MTRIEQKKYILDNINADEREIDYLLDDLGNRYIDLDSVIADLKSNRPIQYISNVAHFYGYQFYVDEGVLIPRPETEELVYQTVNYLKSKSGQVSVLDIGTGSGVIPITTKLEYPSAVVSALDVSPKAIKVTQRNAEKHNVEIEFILQDILSENASKSLGKYDVIISNPPYIPNREKSLMSANVLDHEPSLALFVEDNDPLIFYRRITQLAKQHLNEGGLLLFEINEYFALEMTEMVDNEGGKSKIIKDLQGKDRMMKIWF